MALLPCRPAEEPPTGLGVGAASTRRRFWGLGAAICWLRAIRVPALSPYRAWRNRAPGGAPGRHRLGGSPRAWSNGGAFESRARTLPVSRRSAWWPAIVVAATAPTSDGRTTAAAFGHASQLLNSFGCTPEKSSAWGERAIGLAELHESRSARRRGFSAAQKWFVSVRGHSIPAPAKCDFGDQPAPPSGHSRAASVVLQHLWHGCA